MSENVSPSSFEDVDLSNNTTVNNNNDDYEPIYETLTLPPIISTKKRKGTNKPERPGIVLFLFCFFFYSKFLCKIQQTLFVSLGQMLQKFILIFKNNFMGVIEEYNF